MVHQSYKDVCLWLFGYVLGVVNGGQISYWKGQTTNRTDCFQRLYSWWPLFCGTRDVWIQRNSFSWSKCDSCRSSFCSTRSIRISCCMTDWKRMPSNWVTMLCSSPRTILSSVGPLKKWRKWRRCMTHSIDSSFYLSQAFRRIDRSDILIIDLNCLILLLRVSTS